MPVGVSLASSPRDPGALLLGVCGRDVAAASDAESPMGRLLSTESSEASSPWAESSPPSACRLWCIFSDISSRACMASLTLAAAASF